MNQPQEWDAEMNVIPEHAQKQVMRALMAAYRKHALDDDETGWDELSEIMACALQEAMGDDGFCLWTDAVSSS